MVFLKSFSLLPAAATTTMAVPTVEATTATTGRPARAAIAPTTSSLAMVELI